jgi:hypothetical protein
MVAGGNDTTTGLLGGAAELLTAHPDQRETLRADPRLIPEAVEELLRLTSPVQGLARTVTTDVEIGGTIIPAGRKVMLLYGSANLDPREFGADAEHLDVRRNPRQILTFSLGAHYCLGAAAARASRVGSSWKSCWPAARTSQSMPDAGRSRRGASSDATGRCRSPPKDRPSRRARRRRVVQPDGHGPILSLVPAGARDDMPAPAPPRPNRCGRQWKRSSKSSTFIGPKRRGGGSPFRAERLCTRPLFRPRPRTATRSATY